VIRYANKFDKPEIIEMMKMFRDEADLPEYLDSNNEDYWNQLLDSFFAGRGVIFYEQGKGLLMALIVPTIWDDKKLSMNELAWYVKPEFRNSFTGYKLLKEYIDYGKMLKEQNKISFFTLSKMDTSPNIKYERFGFRKKDENWIQ